MVQEDRRRHLRARQYLLAAVFWLMILYDGRAPGGHNNGQVAGLEINGRVRRRWSTVQR
jgi:hypothetical protein